MSLGQPSLSSPLAGIAEEKIAAYLQEASASSESLDSTSVLESANTIGETVAEVLSDPVVSAFVLEQGSRVHNLLIQLQALQGMV